MITWESENEILSGRSPGAYYQGDHVDLGNKEESEEITMDITVGADEVRRSVMTLEV